MPIQWFAFDVDAPAEVVMDRLRASTGPPRSRVLPLRGSVGALDFDLERAIHYRNSFLPQMHGTVADTGAGSRVSVTMHVHPVVAAMFGVWLAGVLAFCALAANGTPGLAGEEAGLYGMLAFGLALALGGYGVEAVWSRRALESAARADRT